MEMEITSVEKHLKEMKELTDQLAVVGVPTAEDQVVTLLGSMPKKFSTLVTALQARGDDDLSVSYVQQALIHEEHKFSGSTVLTDTILEGREEVLYLQSNRDRLGAMDVEKLDIFDDTVHRRSLITVGDCDWKLRVLLLQTPAAPGIYDKLPPSSMVPS